MIHVLLQVAEAHGAQHSLADNIEVTRVVRIARVAHVQDDLGLVYGVRVVPR